MAEPILFWWEALAVQGLVLAKKNNIAYTNTRDCHPGLSKRLTTSRSAASSRRFSKNLYTTLLLSSEVFLTTSHLLLLTSHLSTSHFLLTSHLLLGPSGWKGEKFFAPITFKITYTSSLAPRSGALVHLI